MRVASSPWFGLVAGSLLLAAAIGGALAVGEVGEDGVPELTAPRRQPTVGHPETHGGMTVTLEYASLTSTRSSLDFLMDGVEPPAEGWVREVFVHPSAVKVTGVADWWEPMVGVSRMDDNRSTMSLTLGPPESENQDISVVIERMLVAVSRPGGQEERWAEGPWTFRFPAGTFNIQTITPSIVVNTIEDAFRLGSSNFTGYGSTLDLAKPESVSYVETTVGDARALLDSHGLGDWGLPDSAPAWAIVAYGQFRGGNRLLIYPPPENYTTVWIVAMQGTEFIRTGGGNERYDLSKLGSVVEVPEPVWREYCGGHGGVADKWCSPEPE